MREAQGVAAIGWGHPSHPHPGAVVGHPTLGGNEPAPPSEHDYPPAVPGLSFARMLVFEPSLFEDLRRMGLLPDFSPFPFLSQQIDRISGDNSKGSWEEDSWEWPLKAEVKVLSFSKLRN
jgi:hypothetical protein